MNYQTETRDKLYFIFMDRLIRVWREKSPSFQIENGGFSIEERKEIEQKWENYLFGMGCSVEKWAEAMSHQGVVIRNPCESPEDFYAKNPSTTTYILMAEEVAEKILVLGTLP